MHSLRMLLFLMLSAAGHAAVLLPLSSYLNALFDVKDVDSHTVIVSIRVAASAENKLPPLTTEHVVQDRRDTVEQAAAQAPIASEQIMFAAAAPAQTFVPAAAEIEPPPVLANEPVPEIPVVTAPSPDQAVMTAVESTARRRQSVAAEEQYLAELLNAISRYRSYPLSARRKGEQGQVEIDLVLLKTGEFESVRISKASEFRSLNRASTRALNRLKGFKPFPAEIERESWRISIPFRYVLNPENDNS